MEQNGNPFTNGLDATYVDFENAAVNGVLAITINRDCGTGEQLSDAMKFLRMQDFVSSVSTYYRDGEHELSVELKPVAGDRGFGNATYMTPDRREQLARMISPEFTRRVTVVARIVRNGQTDVHTGTRITMTLRDGASLSDVSRRSIEGVEGVLRARVDTPNRRVIFTMEAPAANDDGQVITDLVTGVADRLDASVMGRVVVDEPNEDAALHVEYDYVPRKRSVTSAEATVATSIEA